MQRRRLLGESTTTPISYKIADGDRMQIRQLVDAGVYISQSHLLDTAVKRLLASHREQMRPLSLPESHADTTAVA